MPVLITHDSTIDYDVRGKGPPLLLISRLGFGRWGWFKQVPSLSRHFRIITFDIRSAQNLTGGVADLSAKAAALLDHLGIKKTHVLGTSLGGFVAQKLALERPDLVDRLVLVCTSYGGRGPQPMSPQTLGKMFGWGSLSPESAVRRGLETAVSAVYRSGHPEELEQIVRWRLADSPSLPYFYQQAMAGARFDGSRDVRNIVSPTLVIHGAEDCYVPLANARALAKAIPGAKLRVLEDAAHLVFIEQAEEVNEQIVSFLKPRKATTRQRPKKLPEPQKTVFSFELLKRWRPKKVLVEHKTKQLVEWMEEAKKEITYSLGSHLPQQRPRSPRTPLKSKLKKSQKFYRARKAQVGKKVSERIQASFTDLKDAVWLGDARKAASRWEKRLRSWLSLSP
jgi:3-oxoadipate enol-lactonase